MGATRSFDIHGDLAVLRLSDVSLDMAMTKVKSAIALARDLQIPKLLVVAPSLTGPPDNSDFFSKEWFVANASNVRVVIVAKRGLIDPAILGVRCFASEQEAMAWMQVTRS